LTYDLDFQSHASHGRDLHAKAQFQKSVGSKDRVENELTDKRTDGRTDGQTDAIDRLAFPANAVSN